VLLVIRFGWGNTRILYDETGNRGRKMLVQPQSVARCTSMTCPHGVGP
jgi:hypothetical protein